MKSINFSIVALLLLPSMVFAQHSDISFSYEDGSIVMREGIEGFTDGLQIYEANFPTTGFAIRFTENPGFLAEGMDFVDSGDSIEVEVVQSSTFGSYLTYYDRTTNAMIPTDATITIDDNAGMDTADLVIGNTTLGGVNPQFVQTANSSNQVHSHINFFLSAEAEIGAYGMLFRIVTDNGTVQNSELAWLVFNYGLSLADFDDFAIPAFVGTEDEFIPGDVNGDGIVNLLDVAPFVDLISDNIYLPEGDINGDGQVNLLDVNPFIDLLNG